MMLWQIIGEATYWDNDPRMPGTSTDIERIFVPAETYEEARALAKTKMDIFGAKHANVKWRTEIVVIEELCIARVKDSPGLYSGPIAEVKLTIPNGHRLVVRLEKIPENNPDDYYY